VIGACNPGYGQASVALDGHPAGTLDESSCGSALRVPLWWHMVSAAGRHTIVIRPTTSGPEFAVDAVTYSPR
jgi:hypothetical protein